MIGQAHDANTPVARAIPGSSRSFLRTLLKYKYYYVLLLPGLIYFIIFKYIPMGGVVIAFKDYKLTQGITGSAWVGLKWFRILWSTGDFWNALHNTLLISFYKLIFGFPAPLVLAILLNEVMNQKFKRIIQSILYFPHFLSWIVLGGILFAVLSPGTGLLSWLGFSGSPLMQPESFRSLLVLSHIWKEVGWGAIIYLAAIAGVNPEMYEAARMDGASRFRLIRHVTLPAISGTIVIMLILRTGQILSAGFDQVFILSNDVVVHVADILDTYVYRVGLSMGRFSIATAAGLFQSLAGLLLLLFTNWLARRFNDQGLW
ncbi:ABC transporter permease subunit [Paenibacillus filicis]|uniref:ABC transporter permease subunit n=1 Tax=Paenibacillus filicis TaxID=669464 RepID=A0ABU9DQC3_9BACL